MTPGPLRYSRHAKARMEERGISKEQVTMAKNRPIGPPGPGSSPGAIEFFGPPIAGKQLKVVCSAVDLDFVVTVHWIGE